MKKIVRSLVVSLVGQLYVAAMEQAQKVPLKYIVVVGETEKEFSISPTQLEQSGVLRDLIQDANPTDKHLIWLPITITQFKTMVWPALKNGPAYQIPSKHKKKLSKLITLANIANYLEIEPMADLAAQALVAYLKQHVTIDAIPQLIKKCTLLHCNVSKKLFDKLLDPYLMVTRDYTLGAPRKKRSITAMEFSNDGLLCAVACGEGSIELMSGTSLHTLTTLATHKIKKLMAYAGWTRVLKFSPDDTILATGSDFGTIVLWKIADDIQQSHGIEMFHAHKGVIKLLAFNATGTKLVSIGTDNNFVVWDIANSSGVQKIYALSMGDFTSVSFSQNGKMLALGVGERVSLLHARANEGLFQIDLADYDGWAVSMLFSPDNKKIAIASDDATVNIQNLITGTSVTMYDCKRHDSLAFSRDNSIFAACSRDHTVRLYDISSGLEAIQLLHKLTSDKKHPPISALFNSDSSLLAVRSEEAVSLWKVSWKEFTWQQIFLIMYGRQQKDGCVSIATCPDVLKTIYATLTKTQKDLLKDILKP